MFKTCLTAAIAFGAAAHGLADVSEKGFLDNLPSVFARSAAHYRALDAAATPLAKDAKGRDMLPRRWDAAKRELVMRTSLEWTAGHYPGALWYLYEATDDAFFKTRATFWTELLATNQFVTSNHDVGFITYCSYGNARRLLKTDRYDSILVNTANSLCQRFNENLGLIRSWGAKDCKKDFLVIPDNLMNLELLEWAALNSKASAEEKSRFDRIARSHADVTMRHHYRADGGCFHVLDYDQVTKRVQGVKRGQGASTETAWARGQSWSVYGFTMMYRMTGRVRYLEQAIKTAEFALDNPNMPADGVPYWDYGAPGEERDTSAASILASALVELCQYVDPARRARYRAAAVKTLASLASPAYFAEQGDNGDFLLKHAVGHKPGNSEVDVPLNYGDYYFLEALVRLDRLAKRDAERAATAAALPPTATIPGMDTARWREAAKTPNGKQIVRNAEKALSEAIPDTKDELYLEFLDNGNRTHYQNVYFKRCDLFRKLVLGECLERKGRFVPRIVAYVNAFCAMKSWVLPAHDHGERECFRGEANTVDLFASELCTFLGYAAAWLKDELPQPTLDLIRRESERRIFTPMRRIYPMVQANGKLRKDGLTLGFGWIGCEMNWNSVCNDNVTAAALALLDDPYDRALFAYYAMLEVQNAAKGFTPDGYCSEGMGYWNYGYGHLLRLGLTLRDVSGGKLDIFTNPREAVEKPPFAVGRAALCRGCGRDGARPSQDFANARPSQDFATARPTQDFATATRLRKAAEYAYGYMLGYGKSPSFADGNGAPASSNLALVRRVWPDLTCRAAESADLFFRSGKGTYKHSDMRVISLLEFGQTQPPTGAGDPVLPPFTAFPDGQVWLFRAGDFAVGVKGGHNGELHNHNDVGSYHLMVGGKMVSGDPGHEVYTRRTFSKDRYVSKVLNSYGHPVPVVGGQLQGTGWRRGAKVLKAEFADGRGTVELELKKAYPDAKTLRSLVRRFDFDVAAKTFTVTDRAKFSEPTEFESVYTRFDLPVNVDVQVVKGGAFTVKEEKIENPELVSPTRVAYHFDAPVSEAEVAFTFKGN